MILETRKLEGVSPLFKRYLIGVLAALIVCSSFYITVPVAAMDTGIYTVEATAVQTEEATGTTETAEPQNTAEVKTYPALKEGDNGPDVVNLQSRLKDLGYYTFKVTGYYGTLTTYAVTLFQKYNKIDTAGVVGPATNAVLYSNDAVRMPMDGVNADADRLGNTPTPTPKPSATPKKSSGSKGNTGSSSNSGSSSNATGTVAKGTAMDWSEVKTIFTVGTTATVYDYKTGISWTVKRTGGSLHADSEPVTAADTAKYKQALGSSFGSWTRHSMIVVVKGQRLAASYHGYPHGYDSISGNNLTGHFCIHFKNSRTHCSNKIDPAHQACIKACAISGTY